MSAQPWSYIGLSQQFELRAASARDPDLAASYRALAARYRTLDRWHETFRQRYPEAADTVGDQSSALLPANPAAKGKLQ